MLEKVKTSEKGILTEAKGQNTGPARQPYAGINFIPPVRDYEFGC